MRFLKQQGHKITEKDRGFIIDNVVDLFLEEYKTAAKWRIFWNAMPNYDALPPIRNPKNWQKLPGDHPAWAKANPEETEIWEKAGKIIQELKDNNLYEVTISRTWQI